MEFFLVPMVAIVLVTYAIYKLMALVFQIHLSRGLLGLLIVFAWLISFVLPGLFFQTAGFLGSVGISLVSALGFAWIATTYETRRRPEPISSVTGINDSPVDEGWIPSAEVSNPINKVEQTYFELKPSLEPISTVTFVESRAEVSEMVIATEPSPVNEISLLDVSVISDARVFEENEPDLLHAVSEEVEPEIETASNDFVAFEEDSSPPDEDLDPIQPKSDSFEDLLEFAFTQKDQRNLERALTSFRLIQALYIDSSSMPFVLAEIVNLLQSDGRYDEAIEEISKSLEMKGIQQDLAVLRTFEQKRLSLQALRNHLIDQGTPSLPFGQVPAELEIRLTENVLAGNREQF